ncbi:MULTISPECIES: nuclear transport factor 2 family protein [unclassified Streptomyces]|uniref:nuclear transport factor 2 family protein n=1 Tax=unclassified Streptomyces TaxID=2593676 RepID=UPI00225702DC|nr:MULTISPECIES: nuclear transport factor 2 family protein [unclassified Streptomyces]MCX4827741.1 nuclear transport factor 2 family protein [Streptomyces sp. NBC_01016]
MTEADVQAVDTANRTYYEAVERGAFEELTALWLAPEDVEYAEDADPDEAEDTSVSCVHPGWPVLTGRGEVLRSYALIMANTEYIQFFLTDVQISVVADTALVTCTENILSGGPAPKEGDELGPLVGQRVVATNVFRRTREGWKIWSHHASPVLADADDESDEMDKGDDGGSPA